VIEVDMASTRGTRGLGRPRWEVEARVGAPAFRKVLEGTLTVPASAEAPYMGFPHAHATLLSLKNLRGDAFVAPVRFISVIARVADGEHLFGLRFAVTLERLPDRGVLVGERCRGKERRVDRTGFADREGSHRNARRHLHG
jgi:hypothetical protein